MGPGPIYSHKTFVLNLATSYHGNGDAYGDAYKNNKKIESSFDKR